jgi:hypothetical protein
MRFDIDDQDPAAPADEEASEVAIARLRPLVLEYALLVRSGPSDRRAFKLVRTPDQA